MLRGEGWGALVEVGGVEMRLCGEVRGNAVLVVRNFVGGWWWWEGGAELLNLGIVGVEGWLVLRCLWFGLGNRIGFVRVFTLFDGLDDANGVPLCVAEFGLDFLVGFAPNVEELEERGGGEEGICSLSWKILEI